MTKAAYIGVRELPAGYTRLEYVESNGNQYIDTGYVPKSYASGEIDITYIPQVGNTDEIDAYFFGSFDGENALMLNGRDNHSSYVSVGTSYVGMDCYTDVEYTLNISFDGVAIFEYSVTINSSDEVYEDHTDGGTFDGTLPANRSIYLFSLNYDDDDEPYRSFLRIKHFSYKDDGNLVRNYIPVTNPSGVAGLFDTVEQKFYSSNTSTALIAGPAVSGNSVVARKIKNIYVGVNGDVPIYEESTTTGPVTTTITADNIEEFFEVTNNSYYFAGSGGTFTSNNKGVNSSMAASMWCSKKAMSSVAFDWSVSSESSYDDFTLYKIDSEGLDLETYADQVSGTKSGSVSTSLSAGQGFSFDYSKDSSAASGNDCATISNIKVTTTETITVKTPVGTENKDVARKVKKAYVGIGGIARLFWDTDSSGGAKTLSYYGTATALSTARYNLAATTVGNYALFGGGYTGSASGMVNAYDVVLTRLLLEELDQTLYRLAATTVGDYAIFGGGYATSASSVVTAYNTSLIRSSVSSLISAKYDLAATTVGSYALFGGGRSATNYVTAYNASLTRSYTTVLSASRYQLSATTVGDYALFAGGYSKSAYSTVDAYDTTLTRSMPTVLSTARYIMAATTVGNYALFGGGYSSGASSVVDAYDTSLTRSTATALSTVKYSHAATTVGDYAIFGGGNTATSSYTNTVDVYDTSLAHSTTTELNIARHSLAATTLGDYAIFAGGATDSTTASDVVDVYTLV